MKLLSYLILFPIYCCGQNQPSIIGPRYNLYQFTALFKDQNRHPDNGIGLFFLQGLNKKLDCQVGIDAGFTDSGSKFKSNSKSLLLQSEFLVRARALRNNKSFQPYIVSGAGLQFYKNRVGLYWPLGLGIQQRIAKEIYVIVSSRYHVSFPGSINNYFLHSVGFAGTLRPIKARQKKELNAKPLPVKPAISDRDMDGVSDSLDLCPDEPGMQIFAGCPDTDKDGLPDTQDKCPLVFGEKSYSGCPVPDQDSDGIPDDKDSCKLLFGAIENKGCPIDSIDVINKIRAAAHSIQFESGKAILQDSSIEVLDTLVRILNQFPKMCLLVEGHTDNTSTKSFNTALSIERSKAVTDYLTSKGINSTRLKAIGRGDSKPVATNTTIEGRAKNRRVELIVDWND